MKRGKREAKKARGFGRRLLAVFLTVVMCVSMLQLSVFAADLDPAVKQAQEQIKGGTNEIYYTYTSADAKPDPNNSETKGTTNNVVTNNATNGAPEVEVSKTIEATGTENLFDITLNVKTTQKIEEQATSPDASVVLILDLSDSMKTNKIDGKTRIAVAKEKAIDFLTNFVQDANGAARKVAIVTFEKDGAIFNFGSEDAPVYWIDAVANDEDGLNNALVKCINDLQTDHGTNIQAGLQLARNLYDTTNSWASPITNISNRFSVLLTDGAPTVKIADKVISNSATSFVGTTGYDNIYEPIAEAKALDTLTDSFVICFASDIQTWMKDTGTSKTFDKAVKAANSDQLKATFDMIIERIKLAVDAWRVTDSIPADSHLKLVEVLDPTTHNGDALEQCPVVGSSGALVWNLRKDLTGTATKIYAKDGKTELTSEQYKGYNDIATVVYELKYRVKLDTAASGFEEGKFYLTNGITKLNYYLQDSNGNFLKDNGSKVGDSESALLTQYFKIPAVKGYTADLAFTKVGSDGKNLLGAQFTLTNAANTWSDVATSSASGEVVFAKQIPSGDTYTLTETTAPAGYLAVDPVEFTVAYGNGVPSFNGRSLVDPVEVAYTDVTITKTWRSPNGVTPDSITVTLKQNGSAMADYTNFVINKSDCAVDTLTGVWSYTFEDLIALDERGNTYTYTVEEVVPDGYKVDGQGTLNLINTATGKVNVIVTKEWLLPDTMNTTTALVDVILYANGVEVAREKNVNDGRTVSFMNLDKYNENGQTILYTVGEESNAVYQQVAIDKVAEAGPTTMYTIVNTVAEEYDATVSGTKIWKDDNDATNRKDITVALYADGVAVDGVTAVATADTNWQYSFTGLQRYNFIRSEAGRIIGVQEIVYTVQEVGTVDGYTSSAVGTDVINTRVGTVNFTVTKEWAADLKGAEHGAVSAILYANGHPVAESESFVDSYTFVGLDKYDADGVAIVYDVIEVPVDGYTASYSDVTIDEDGNYAQTITNTRDDADDTLTITVTKVWKQPGDVEAQTATFQLFKGDNETTKFLQITGNGVGYFENLPRYKEVTVVVSEDEETGEKVTETELVEIDYNVEEIDIPRNYINTIAEELEADSSGNFTCNFVNTITGTTDIFVEKSWVKPTSITAPEITVSVQVYDLDKGEWVALNDGIVIESGESNGSMKKLPAYDADGRRMSYRVTELSVPGYSSAVNGGYNGETGDYEYSIVNSINPSNSEITVSKQWLDGNTPAAERPDVTLQLLRDGQEYDTVEFWYDASAEKVMATTKYDTVEAIVSEDGNTYSVKLTVSDYSADLTMKYAYSVAEWNVPAGYTSEVTGSYSVTNTSVGTIDIDVTKYWTDPGDVARPDITLTLTGKVGDTVVKTYDILVSDDTGAVVATMNGAELVVDANGNTWTITAAGLSQYYKGSKITYTLSEAPVAGYTAERVDEQPFAINNVIDDPCDVTVSATKVWGNMDVQGVYTPKYPASITVALFRDGMKVEGSEQTVTQESDYAIESYTELEKYAPNGARYSYQILELKADGSKVDNNGTIKFGANNEYTVTYGEDGTITNTFIVPAKYMWIVKTNYVHKNYDGTTISSYSNQTEVYTEIESKTVSVDPAEYVVCPQDGLTYELDTSKDNITSVELARENQLYELVINYILVEDEPPAPPAPPSGGGGGGGGGSTIIIPEDPVPLAPVPEEPVIIPEEPEFEEILDEEIPLADVPKTGDASALWMMMSVLSGSGLAGMAFLGRKKRED